MTLGLAMYIIRCMQSAKNGEPIKFAPFSPLPKPMLTDLNGLKPCPFCGKQEAYLTSNCYGQNYVRCPNCGAVVWGNDDENLTEKRAVELWNRRADNG